MKQSVAAEAHHFGAIPAEERAGSEADAGGVSDAAQADGAALLLVGNCPTQAEKADHEARD